jgi:predicted nucleic acid-binding protein
MTWVIDSSIAVKWGIPEVMSDKADRVREQDAALVAPDLLPIEAANALWRKSRLRELSAREADRALQLVLASGVDFRPSAVSTGGHSGRPPAAGGAT